MSGTSGMGGIGGISADLRHLRWPLAGLLAAILVGIGLGGGGYWLAQTAAADERRAVAEQGAARSQLSRAAEEEQELREKIGRFLVLQQRGLVGRENRLDWIEQLAQLSREHKLTDFQYDFTPQRPIDALLLPGGERAGNHRFLVSSQRFSARLLHEGDLLRFLAAVQSGARAQVIIRACNIGRLPRGEAERGLDPQLEASCELDWITLQEAR